MAAASTVDQAGSLGGLHPRRVPQDLRRGSGAPRCDRGDWCGGSAHGCGPRMQRLAELQRLEPGRRLVAALGDRADQPAVHVRRRARGGARRARCLVATAAPPRPVVAVDGAGRRHPGAGRRRRDRGVDRPQPGRRAAALRPVDGAGGHRCGAGHPLREPDDVQRSAPSFPARAHRFD